MLKMKKIISVVLTLTLVFGVFSITSFAWTGSANEPLGFELVADKTKVNPGDTVTLTLKLHTDGTTFPDLVSGAVSFMYNTNVLTAGKLTYGPEMEKWALIKPLGKIVTATAINNVKNKCSADEKTEWEANGYNAIGKFQFNKDGNTEYGSQGYWTPSDGMVMATVEFTVGDVEPGTVINFGSVSGLAEMKHTAFQTWENGTVAGYKYGAAYYDDSAMSVSLTVAAAGPALTHVGRQVKMDVAGGAVVSGTEQLRVVSSISNDDWNNYFANTTVAAATTKKLLEVGIVATQGAFDMTAAQDAAKLGKGVHGDYTVATTTYIQNTGSDYRFGARIEYQTNVFDTTYVAFAKYLNAEGAEAYVFYDASYALAFATNYSTITADYINFLNSQAA